jgi:hypothetical protein
MYMQCMCLLDCAGHTHVRTCAHIRRLCLVTTYIHWLFAAAHVLFHRFIRPSSSSLLQPGNSIRYHFVIFVSFVPLVTSSIIHLLLFSGFNSTTGHGGRVRDWRGRLTEGSQARSISHISFRSTPSLSTRCIQCAIVRARADGRYRGRRHPRPPSGPLSSRSRPSYCIFIGRWTSIVLVMYPRTGLAPRTASL